MMQRAINDNAGGAGQGVAERRGHADAALAVDLVKVGGQKLIHGFPHP